MIVTAGMDPGRSGAVAVYDPAYPNKVAVFDLPGFVEGKSTAKIPDPVGVLNLLSSLVSMYGVERFAIEKLNGYNFAGVKKGGKGMSGASQAKMMDAYGVQRCAAHATGCGVHYVTPATWKKFVGATKDKETSRRLATELFPASVHLWRFKKDADKCEAALIAYYLSQFLQMNLPR